MITNVPTSDDYYTSGKELLNFAWDATASLLVEFGQAGYYGFEPADIEEMSDAYWAAAKRTLTTALTVVQQAVELIIKGRIVEISPYLLISDIPARWPSPYDSTDPIDFEDFRTIDAQDLIRVHDTFAQKAFNAEFTNKFNELRKIRNVVMHSVGKKVSVTVAEVVDSALFMHKALFPAESWFTIRREFLRRAPDSELGASEFATNNTCHEATIVKDLLQPAQIQAYLGVDKKQHSFVCPACLDDANTDGGFEYRLAVLRPKGSGTTELYCPVCNGIHIVRRQPCEDKNCPSTVISEESCRCLLCTTYQRGVDDPA
ncbi:hypothetical protein K788_00002190 [Paraburkholderia caribensis MBA4]|uniref:Uncharacterized protein n=1 Tax=Paraburkholderia caribensis MBA4 TaxID=1323664 RepID=A0A0P0RIF2_9BURK|nr:hypothetical protein [Paraburkholderia caribensis]ALL68536.1 hypothetical protein K788_00002190 [Paraburkholderia caribensis MBA4]